MSYVSLHPYIATSTSPTSTPPTHPTTTPHQNVTGVRAAYLQPKTTVGTCWHLFPFQLFVSPPHVYHKESDKTSKIFAILALPCGTSPRPTSDSQWQSGWPRVSASIARPSCCKSPDERPGPVPVGSEKRPEMGIVRGVPFERISHRCGEEGRHRKQY